MKKSDFVQSEVILNIKGEELKVLSTKSKPGRVNVSISYEDMMDNIKTGKSSAYKNEKADKLKNMTSVL